MNTALASGWWLDEAEFLQAGAALADHLTRSVFLDSSKRSADPVVLFDNQRLDPELAGRRGDRLGEDAGVSVPPDGRRRAHLTPASARCLLR